MINKIKAVMLGHAVGDALGVPVEFCMREKLIKNPVTDMMGYGSYPVPAGSWSDDTSMSLCALDALCNKEWTLDHVMDNLVKWISDAEFTPTGKVFDVGRCCLSAIVRYQRTGIPADKCGGRSELENGNGSLMRIHPFVLYLSLAARITRENRFDGLAVIKKASELTHAHSRSVMGCYIYAYCLSALLFRADKPSIKDALTLARSDLSLLPEFDKYSRIFREDFERLSADEIKSSGYVVDTLEAALWCVLTTDSYSECVLKAVNLGEDTDTVAAIAGSLAGALYGYDAIPKKWLDTLLKREYIEDMCERAYQSWI